MLYEVVSKNETLVEDMSASIGAELGTLPRLRRLISLTSIRGFGESWIVAVAYLQALEVIVNKLVKILNIEARKEAGLKKSSKLLSKCFKVET